MKHLAGLALTLACLAAAGCERRPPAASAAPQARYTIGPAWTSQGYWFYPREEASYAASGLAIVDAQRPGPAALTADGERYDPRSVAAAHQTLQLPVTLRVRNLENGREVLVRVNDRGPGSPGRLLSVTPAAGLLLGMDPDRATRVELEEDDSLSHDLLRGVAGAPPPELVAAPVGSVREESLMPGRATGDAAASSVLSDAVRAGPRSWSRPAAVFVLPPQPGQLWIDAGHFSQPGYARRLAELLGGAVRQDGRGRSTVFYVRVGPLDRVDEADSALDRARSAGVTGARIIVE